MKTTPCQERVFAVTLPDTARATPGATGGLRDWTGRRGRGMGGVVAAGFVNGALHRGDARALGEPSATQLSEIVLPVLVASWALRIHDRRPLPTLRGAVAVGTGWMLATVTFEFLFGHYVNGDSWEKLRTAYNLAEGHLWSLNVAVIASAPAFAHVRWHRRTERR